MARLPTHSPARADLRERIVAATARLLAERGATGVTTRAVAEASGVQAPTIYRLFGDKDGLLDAVAEHTMTRFVAEKSRVAEDPDPVTALRNGWDQYLAFALANPALFVLLTEPERSARFLATATGVDLLDVRVSRVAAAGRLQVSEQRAVDLIRVAGTGTVLTLLARAPDERDPGLAEAAYAAVTAAILTDAPTLSGAGSSTTRAAAVAVRAAVDDLTALTPAERAVLAEWLDRVSA